MTHLVTCHAGLRLALRRKIRSEMSVITAASNNLAQAAVVDQVAEAKAVVAAKAVTDVALQRKNRSLI